MLEITIEVCIVFLVVVPHSIHEQNYEKLLVPSLHAVDADTGYLSFFYEM